MTDEIPEDELNEWLKTLFFALKRMCLPGPTINLLTRALRFQFDVEESQRKLIFSGLLLCCCCFFFKLQ